MFECLYVICMLARPSLQFFDGQLLCSYEKTYSGVKIILTVKVSILTELPTNFLTDKVFHRVVSLLKPNIMMLLNFSLMGASRSVL